MKKPEMLFKALLLKEYEDRLYAYSSLNETNVKDDQGNVVIDNGLKVRHKKSGFEYTIKKVNDANGRVSIVLRTPNSPRVDNPTIPDQVIAGVAKAPEKYSNDQEHSSFTIDQDEFEKEYEVD